MTMKLADTVGDMLSDLQSRRIVAEYNQLVIRIGGLENYVDGLNNKHDDKYLVLMEQLYCMYNYREALKKHINYLNILRKYNRSFIFLKSGCVTLKSQ